GSVNGTFNDGSNSFVLARDVSPVAEGQSYVFHIHRGTCASVGSVVRTRSNCGEPVAAIQDVSERRCAICRSASGTPGWCCRAWVACPRCGPTVEAVPWLDRYQRMTRRLAEKLARRAEVWIARGRDLEALRGCFAVLGAGGTVL
ncbi:MAG: hypothetical protein ABIP66_16705, partial [Gemmatimonadaceae bacterium]